MENPVMNIVRSKRSPSHVHEKTFDFENCIFCLRKVDLRSGKNWH